MTLIEVVIATAIAAVTSLVVSSLFVFAIDQFQLLVEQNNAEEDLLSAAYYTRLYFSNAAEVVSGLPPPGTTGGVQCPFRLSVAGANPVIVGSFLREMGPDAGNNSLLVPTAIFAVAPQYNANPPPGTPNHAGMIKFVGRAGAAVLTANSDGIVIDHLVEYQIGTPGQPCDVDAFANKLKTLSVTITVRYFKSNNRVLWDYTNPNPAISYRDVTMNVLVGLRNNVIRPSLTGVPAVGGGLLDERLHGPIYYFRFASPPPSSL